jgi:hypothetical protein
MNLENGIAHMYMRMYPGGADFAVLQQLYAEGDKRKIRREFLRKFYRPFGFLSSFVHAMIFFQLALLLSTCFILTYMFDWSFFP